jgi:hypothetical protein
MGVTNKHITRGSNELMIESDVEKEDRVIIPSMLSHTAPVQTTTEVSLGH